MMGSAACVQFQLHQYSQPFEVGRQVLRAVGGYAAVVVKKHLRQVVATVAIDGGGHFRREAFQAHGDRVFAVVHKFFFRPAQRFVFPVEQDISPIGLLLQALGHAHGSNVVEGHCYDS